jgi:hypothetical protein
MRRSATCLRTLKKRRLRSSRPGGPNLAADECGVTNPLAAPPQPEAPDYPSVFPDLPGRTATEDEFREYFGELEPDDEP